jgi:chromosome segregation ATPase
MSTEVVRELFRNFENTLHDRLKVIEDILTATSGAKHVSVTAAPVDLSEVERKISEAVRHIHSVEEYAMGEVRTLAYNHDMLEKRVVSLESSMRSAAETLLTINTTIGSLQKRMDDERPVEAAEVEAEIEQTQEAALEEEVVEEEVAEEEEVEEEVAEEEEEEEEEEQEELDLEVLEYRKRTYARDQHNNVYNMDDEGTADVSQIVGIWNPKTKKIEPVPNA